MDDTPIFRALAAEHATRHLPPAARSTHGGRHCWVDEPRTEELPVSYTDDPAHLQAPAAPVRVEVLPTTPTMKRHIAHDPRSRAFALPTTGDGLRAVRWARHGPVYDQNALLGGQGLGCCTMCTGFGLLMTDPYAVPGRYFSLDPDVVQGYAEETALDDRDIPGRWPPDDTGSAGLWMAKVLKRRGLIAGYRHAFGLSATLLALQDGPLAIGTVWLESMNEPDRRGRLAVDPESAVAGGHEYILDEFVPDSRAPGGGWVGKHGSWGADWGIHGRAYLSVRDLDWLLRQDGDVIQLQRVLERRR